MKKIQKYITILTHICYNIETQIEPWGKAMVH